MIKGKSITQNLHMQWLSNFNQSFYYTRLAYPQNFIIFGSQKLKIWFKQVCMHSKTHFKFQFNSSKFSTTSVHVVFFLNTRPPCESNKIGSTQFGSTNWELQKSQISIQNCIFELAYWVWLTDNRDPLVRGPRLSAKPKAGDDAGRCGSGASSSAVRSPVRPRPPSCLPRRGGPVGA